MTRRLRGCAGEEQRQRLSHERCLSQEDADLDTDCAPFARLCIWPGNLRRKCLRSQSSKRRIVALLNRTALASIFLWRRKPETYANGGLAGLKLGGNI